MVHISHTVASASHMTEMENEERPGQSTRRKRSRDEMMASWPLLEGVDTTANGLCVCVCVYLLESVDAGACARIDLTAYWLACVAAGFMNLVHNRTWFSSNARRTPASA